MGGTNTFQVWARPVTDPAFERYADHVFVYCPDNDQYFGCWNGGATTDAGAVEVASSTQSNNFGNSPYETANCYRTPISVGGETLPDTAGIGVYGINGVCHQSAQLFFWAVSNLPYGMNNGRPNGYVASLALYGPFGALAPGDLASAPAFHATWLASVYAHCRGLFPLAAAEQPAGAGTLGDEHQRESAPVLSLNSPERIAWEFAAHVTQRSPEVRLEDFIPQHIRLLRQKEELIASDWKGQPAIGESLAEQINDLGETMQQELEGTIGSESYTALTGLQSGERIRVVDPRIASGHRTF